MAKQPFENLMHHLFQVVARAEFKPLSDQDLLKRYVENRDELAFGELARMANCAGVVESRQVLGPIAEVQIGRRKEQGEMKFQKEQGSPSSRNVLDW